MKVVFPDNKCKTGMMFLHFKCQHFKCRLSLNSNLNCLCFRTVCVSVFGQVQNVVILAGGLRTEASGLPPRCRQNNNNKSKKKKKRRKKNINKKPENHSEDWETYQKDTTTNIYQVDSHWEKSTTQICSFGKSSFLIK